MGSLFLCGGRRDEDTVPRPRTGLPTSSQQSRITTHPTICHPERRAKRGVEGPLSDLVLFSVGLLSGYVARWPRFAKVEGRTREQAPKGAKELTTGLINSFARVTMNSLRGHHRVDV